MADSETFSLINRTKGKLPSLPFLDMKNAVLGPEYDLSVVFVGDEESRKINIETRDKGYIPNVLSFPLNDVSGEIFLNPLEAPVNMVAFFFFF